MAGPGQRRWRLVRASTDAVPASVRRVFMAARRRGWRGLAAELLRRTARRLRRRGRLGVLVGAGVAVLLLAGWLLWGTSLAGVREVRVTGTTILTSQQVRDAAAVVEQTPLLRVRTGEVAARVATLPPVAAVQVRRDWPDALVVEVRERTAVAAVPVADPSSVACEPDQQCFQLVDAAGVGFLVVPEQPEDLPVVVVAEPGPDQPDTRAALAVLAALTPQLRAELTALTVQGPASIQLTLASDRTVLWGEPTNNQDKARVATVLLDREGEVIDVSALEVVSVR
ncbi:MAG: FtsQ-type POTRA domain-containing protein [Micromonosporaceae bacterium]|nr:FtsQ-type POTRA domain-containing protein [Micromonosporaceae bacterium]